MTTKTQRGGKFSNFIGASIHSLVWGVPLLAMAAGAIFLMYKLAEWLQNLASTI